MTRAEELAQAARLLEHLTGRRTLLALDDDPQALLMIATPDGEVVLGVLDRDGDTAAITLTLAGVTRLHNALTSWLEGRA